VEKEDQKEEKEIYMMDYDDLGGRIRLLGTIQSNERRHKQEIACFFFQIKEVMLLEKINILEVMEWYSNPKM
jgi:hypothetical protein